MEVRVYGESGSFYALFGLGLSYGLTSHLRKSEDVITSELENRLKGIAQKLAHKNNAENKFLRQISVCLDVTAPLYWWKQADTYKIGTTAQSESTMHTLMRGEITQANFEFPIFADTLKHLEGLRQCGEFEQLVNELPCGWLQRRILSCNYAVLQNIYNQRRHHKLKEWHIFCDKILSQVLYPEFIKKEDADA